jgi:hypothetical protein
MSTPAVFRSKENSMEHSHKESLLAHQWSGYPKFHCTRRNLLIHIVAVPVFLAANVGLVISLFRGAWAEAAIAAALMGTAMSVQGRGHQMEPAPPAPFTGPLNVLARLFAEQWITFPRFVLTGRWLEALRRQPTGDRPSR